MFGNSLRSRLQQAGGFSLTDLLATLAVAGTIAGVAVPIVTNAFENQRLNIDTRNVERELQTARLAAVGTNRPIRVRFNCPSAGRYRRVELIGTLTVPATDDADARANVRCGYPYPVADTNPLTRPNNDGPPMQLYSTVAFSVSQALEFWPNGTVHAPGNAAQLGAPVSITLTKGSSSKTIQVNGLGKIQIN
jgi:Tfp pilus assembly protein FimT